jgi:hypothetical protein
MYAQFTTLHFAAAVQRELKHTYTKHTLSNPGAILAFCQQEIRV